MGRISVRVFLAFNSFPRNQNSMRVSWEILWQYFPFPDKRGVNTDESQGHVSPYINVGFFERKTFLKKSMNQRLPSQFDLRVHSNISTFDQKQFVFYFCILPKAVCSACSRGVQMSQAVPDLNTYCDVKDTRPINGLQMKRIRNKGQHNFYVMGFYSEGSALLS